MRLKNKILILLGGGIFFIYFYQFPLLTKISQSFRPPKIENNFIRKLSILSLDGAVIDNIAVEKLSGLAWDRDNNLLLAVSDVGYLFHFSIIIDNNKLIAVTPVAVFPLLDEQGNKLAGKKLSDAEGLVLSNANNGIKDDTRLWVSFEQKMRVVKYTSEGKWLERVALPSILQQSNNYDQYNSGLEAITWHSKYGLLVAPEYHLKNEAIEKRVIYSIKNKHYPLRWQVRALPFPEAGLVAIEAINAEELLLLERAWSFPFNRAVIALRRINLEDCPSYQPCPIKNSFLMETDKGWGLDNYEGLAQLDDNRFMMVSDDNGMPFQSTLFALFSIAK